MRMPFWMAVLALTALPYIAHARFDDYWSYQSPYTQGSRTVTTVPINSTDFNTIKDEYVELYAACAILSNKVTAANTSAQTVINSKARYETVATQIGCPWWVVGIIHGLESSHNFNTWLANGDPLTGPTTHVPAGLTVPDKTAPYTWEDAAIVSLKYMSWDTYTTWDLPHVLYRLEAYNGWGYRKYRSKWTDYLVSFTNYQTAGRYVADGVWDPEAWSAQVGAIATMKALEGKGISLFGTGTADPNNIYLNFNYTGTCVGTAAQPFNTMDAAIAALNAGGTLHLTGGTSTWTGTISKAMTIVAEGGSVTIGR